MSTITGEAHTANGEIFVSVYALNTTDLAGYTVTLAYDTTQVSFKRVGENGLQSEKNMLFSNGGMALFIGTPPENGRVEFAGVSLGAFLNTTPSGNGLLALYRFIPTAQFSETNFQIDRAIFQSGDVRDTVATGGIARLVADDGSPIPSTGAGEEIPGLILIDLDPAEGNQGLKLKGGIKSGDIIKVQLFADEFPEISGFGVNIETSQGALIYIDKSFVAGEFIPGGLVVATNRDGIIDAGVASLSGATGRGTGFLGELDLRVTDSFVDSTYFAIVTVGFTLRDGTIQEVPVRIIGRLETAGGLVGDFSGDGTVGFSDFILFAQAFGSPVFDPKYDLSNDGKIGFADFLIFATVWGTRA